jgi:NTP pyrophosphatase (non-canonical NTP hydrolase)
MGSVERAQSWPSDVQEQLRAFATERGWGKYHTPRNLLLALTGELGELAELYQWCGDDLTELPSPDRVADEVADVAIYLLRFADVAGVDIVTAVADKIARNQVRFPSTRAARIEGEIE